MVKNIMIVDDARDTTGMVKKLLESEGYNTITAYDGKEALEILNSADVKPDLLILDMFMPEMSGREVCERIRKDNSFKDMKVAFFTAAAFSNEGKKKLKELDVIDYIVKPFDVDDFLKRVRKILGE
jgi:DNA-binding response OmpR family regulator